MLDLIPAISIFIVIVFLFFREDYLDQKRYKKLDREGDAHITQEIEKFKHKMGLT